MHSSFPLFYDIDMLHKIFSVITVFSTNEYELSHAVITDQMKHKITATVQIIESNIILVRMWLYAASYIFINGLK